jgi:DNA-directed RNA polymerase specialized sigma24 family protein
MPATETTREAFRRLRRLPKISGLLTEMWQAAEEEDRPRFDEAFDACLEQVYGVAWAFLGDRERAQEITAQILLAAASSLDRSKRP